VTSAFAGTVTGFPERPFDPSAKLDFPADWSQWLAPGASIVDVQMKVPPEIVVDDTMLVSPITTAWLRMANPDSAEPGNRYDVTYHVTDSDGREDDRSITLVIQER